MSIEDIIKNEIYKKNIESTTKKDIEELKEDEKIESFRYTFLSNFYSVPIDYNWQKYPSVEHAYQAQKFSKSTLEQLTDEQIDILNDILKTRWHNIEITDITKIFTNPSFTSWNIKVVVDQISDWINPVEDRNEIKITFMIKFLLQKFSNEDLKNKLLMTDDRYLIEWNTWWDTYWWYVDGEGNNFLGRILMYIRDSVIKK